MCDRMRPNIILKKPSIADSSFRDANMFQQTKHFVAAISVTVLVWNSVYLTASADASLLKIDERSLISQADLIYESPATASVEGLPIGNGRMGTLVWTTPHAIHLQVNRNDVFAVNSEHAGAQFGPTDYCGGCAGITVDVGGPQFEAGSSFSQRLSLYDAEVSIKGEAVGVSCFVSANMDVLVMKIDDRRPEPQAIRMTLSMWRDPKVVSGNHVAQYEFAASNNSASVVQRFTENDYHCASAVTVRVVGDASRIEATTEKSRTLVISAQKGKRTILVSSAASRMPDADVGNTAAEVLNTADRQPYEALRNQHKRWWHDFWSRTFIHLESDDGVAEFMQQVRTLHLYYMASTSRGSLPPKWNGSLFVTEGDDRQWGSQFWIWTTEMLYFPLLAADAIDLTEPYFDMYVRQLPKCEKASSQRWNSRGVYFPETTAFDGPTILPDESALEFQDVLLGRKPHTDLSARALERCQFDSHLRVVTNPREGRYAWISHVASSGSELAVQAWWRYRYTGDKEWLRTHAYPLLRGTVEFYRHLVHKGVDGLYHLQGTNAHEDFWGVKDGIMDLAAIRATVPLAIHAARTLQVDAEPCIVWDELLENLTPYPMGSDPQSKALTGSVLADDVWAAGHLGDVNGQHNPEDVWLNPVFPFEDWTLETRQPASDRIVQKTLDLAPRHASVLNGSKPGTAIRTPIAIVRAGRGRELPAVLASYYAAFSPLSNGMSLFEGKNAQSIEHLGLISTTLQDALLQCVSARPGQPEIISVFPAWPMQWDASFTLLARGGFLVTSSIRHGETEFIEIHSRRGESCRLRNPWDGPCVISRIDGPAKEQSGNILRFSTQAGGRYRVTPKDKPVPEPHEVLIERRTGPTSYQFILANQKTVGGVLGRKRTNP
jgi:Domain of unknown function (DUF5703)/Glycosyl hydrolase family 95 catalytic domain/Glycoside hydrolase family 95, C-terminal domain